MVLAKLAGLLRPGARHRVRTPTVLQMEAVECGAASLAMVLAWHGRYVPLEELRILCGVSRDGSKASNVLKAARSFGLAAKGFRKEPEALRSMPLPMIVFWNFNHFVVVDGFGEGKVFLNDPGCGRRTVSDEEFDQSFTGVVLTFEATPEFTRGGEKPSVVGALKRRFHGLGPAVAFLVLAGLAMVLPGLLVPAFSGMFVDHVLVGGKHTWLKPLLLGMALTAALRAALTWLEQYYLLRTQTRIALSGASQFLWHLLHLPVEFYAQRSAGEIGARVALNDRVAQLLSGDLAKAALNVLTAVFFIALMLAVDTGLTAIVLVFAVLNLVVFRLTATKARELSQRVAIDEGKMMGAAVNGLMSMETLKASGAESDFFGRWAGYQAKYLSSMQESLRVMLPLRVLPGALDTLAAVLVLGAGALSVIHGQFSVGTLIAFQTLAASFMKPIKELAGLGSQLQEAHGDMNRLDDVARYAPDAWATRTALAGGEPRPRFDGAVTLDRVTFGYSRAEEPLLQDFSLTLRPGERVAIVGGSGSGKSTVAKLVMGLYQPWRGQVLFDGQPREAYSRYEFASSVAMVDQDVALFSGTIRDNLSLWDPGVSDEDLVRAASDACIHEFILSRPGGYDHVLEEGGRNMSGGQRQRLEIARALVGNPRVLVLDEATSALDPATEQAIESNLRRRGCTCVIVAHRLSAVRDCDEIVVLSHGQLAERGTHEALMGKPGGAYHRLVSME
jgi:NHLM bacteriocin system ABC transporter peptidase/ATP-binding protein